MLRLFESNEVAAAPQILSGSPGIPQALPQQSGHWDQDIVGLGDPVSCWMGVVRGKNSFLRGFQGLKLHKVFG